MNFTHLFFSCQGRIGRFAFGLTTLALLGVNALSAGLFQLIGLPVLSVFVTLAIAYPTWALSIKRAHDIGKSGWWLFGWTFAPLLVAVALILVILSGLTENMGVAIFLYLSMLPLSAISARTIYKLSFHDSEPGANAYGQTEPFLRQLFNSADEFLPAKAAAPADPAPRVQAAAKPAPAAARSTPARAKPSGFGRRGGLTHA